MAIKDLIPWNNGGREVGIHRGADVNPFFTLHREMNRMFDDVPQDEPEIYAEPGFEDQVSAFSLFAYLSRSDVTWNPSVASVCKESLFCPTTEEYILPTEAQETVPLWPTQQQGIAQSLWIMENLGSVLVSDATGSGKTPMATAVIETLIEGDSDNLPNPRAAYLWLSDQPELNEQTRRKMLAASTVLDVSRLVVVDAAFDMEQFAPFSRAEARKRLSLPQDGSLVLAVGNLVAEKGFDLVIRAVSALHNVRLLIVGEGPLRDDLASLARSVAPGRVEFRRNMPELLANSASKMRKNGKIHEIPCRIPCQQGIWPMRFRGGARTNVASEVDRDSA